MSESRCTSHHHSCDCREAKIKRLVQAVRKAIEDMDSEPGFDAWVIRDELHDRLEEWEGEFEE